MNPSLINLNTLNQILRVLTLSKIYRSRGIPLQKAIQQAIKDTSHEYDVTYQTIGDGCRRRLGLVELSQFIDMVDRWIKGDSTQLAACIASHTQKTNLAVIERFFHSGEKPGGLVSTPNASTSPKLDEVREKKLAALQQLEGVPNQELFNLIFDEGFRRLMGKWIHE